MNRISKCLLALGIMFSGAFVVAGCGPDDEAEVLAKFPNALGGEARQIVYYSHEVRVDQSGTFAIEQIELPGGVNCFIPYHRVYTAEEIGTMFCVPGAQLVKNELTGVTEPGDGLE